MNEAALSPRFAPALRVFGIGALIAALTTFLNTMLPYLYDAEGFDARMALIHNPFYAFRQWVLLVHPAFTLVLALGFGLAVWARAPGRAIAGTTFAFVEKMTEFWLGVTILFVVNGVWKADYLAAIGTPAAAPLRAQIEGFNEILGGSFFLLWSMFVLSNGLFASALDRRDGLERWVAITALFTVGLTLLMLLGSFAGQAWTDPIIDWLYAPGLTLHRLLVGLWLLRIAATLARDRVSPA